MFLSLRCQGCGCEDAFINWIYYLPLTLQAPLEVALSTSQTIPQAAGTTGALPILTYLLNHSSLSSSVSYDCARDHSLLTSRGREKNFHHDHLKNLNTFLLFFFEKWVTCLMLVRISMYEMGIRDAYVRKKLFKKSRIPLHVPSAWKANNEWSLKSFPHKCMYHEPPHPIFCELSYCLRYLNSLYMV